MAGKYLTKTVFALWLAVVMLLGNPGRSFVLHAEESDVVITKQPEDVEVNYPDGASFHVEVDHPENVASYQWYLSDGWTVFELDGESAKTDTLILPSLEYTPNPHYLSCEITDKNGNKIHSEDAVLTNPNFDDDLKVLYVGEHGILPGETLDLAKEGVGSGTVTYDVNGVDATFENVHYSNETVIFDKRLSPSMGVFFFGRHMEEPEIHFHFKGDNVFESVFFDEEYNNAGVVFNCYFGIEENAPTAVFEGDGTLTLNGGSNSIYADGNIDLAMKINATGLENVYSDAITGNTILVENGAELNLKPNGIGIRARGDLRTFEGSVISIDSIAPHVSVGPTFKSLIQVAGVMNCVGTEINLHGTAYPDTFIPYGNYLVNFTGITLDNLGDLNLDSTKIDISFDCEEGSDLYALNFCGIIGGENSSSLVLENGSSVNINIDVPTVTGSTGILFPGDVRVEEDCSISLNIASLGEASGIETLRGFIVNDGNVTSHVKSYNEQGVYGIVSGDILVNINDSKYAVSSIAEKGLALAADTGERSGEDVKPIDGYKARMINLAGKASIIEPKNAEINVCAVPGYGDFITAETVFVKGNLETPASEVKISVRQSNALYYGLAAFALLAIGAMLFLKKKRKKA